MQRTFAAGETIDLNRVRIFVQVAEDGAFTSAGKKLSLSTAAVSRSVSQLEGELGVRLLQRTTRKLRLTDAGRAYLDKVSPALASLKEAATAARDLQEQPSGRVRVAAPTDAGTYLAELLGTFRARYPLISIEVALSLQPVDLVADGFDMAVRGGKLVDSRLVVRRLHNSRFCLYGAPAYLARRGTPRRMADLDGHDWVHYQPFRAVTLIGPEGERAFQPKGGVVSDDLTFVRQSIAAGLGLGILPDLLGHAAVRTQTLVRVLPECASQPSALNLVMPNRSFEPRAVTLFRDALVEHMARQQKATLT